MKHFIFSDIHGNWELFEQILNFLNSQEDEWQCIVIGDACDRGPAGYKIMKHLLDDKRFIYLAGNHEHMFVNTAVELCNIKNEENWTHEQMILEGRSWLEFYSNHTANHYFGNGGDSTFEAWLNDGAPWAFVYKIKRLPIIMSYEKYDIMHGGCYASTFKYHDSWDEYDEYDALWNRTHFINPWTKNRTMIHGHTPICNMPRGILRETHHYTWKPIIYNGGEKINMDCATYHSGRISIMDLDTGEFYHFATEEALPIDF